MVERISAFDRRAGGVAVAAWSVVLLVLVSFGLTVATVQAGARTDQETAAARTVVRDAREVQAILLDAETGQRGYLITQDTSFLVPYATSDARLEQALASLEGASDQLGGVHPGLLEVLARVKLDHLQTAVELTKQGRADDAATLVASGAGRRVMDDVRDEAARVVADAAQIADTGATRSVRLRALATTTGALAVVSVLALVVLLLRHQTRLEREQAAAELEAREAVGRLERLSTQDALTGLMLRRPAEEELARALARSRRDGTGLAVVLCDVDRFTELNSRLGSGGGDAVLVAAVQALTAMTGAADLLARAGPDEILLVVEPVASVADAEQIARRVAEAVELDVEVDGQTVATSASVGLVVVGLGVDPPGPAPGVPATTAQVLSAADEATNGAKQAGGRRVHLFDPATDVVRGAHYRIVGELRQALEDPAAGGLWVAYQPLVDLMDDQVFAFEALVRWEHPDRGPLPPGQFVPHVEASELIVGLDRHVLRTATHQVAHWNAERRRRGLPPLRVSVNCAPRTLADPGLVSTVKDALAESGLAPTSLVLEITESAVVQATRVVADRLATLVDLGVTIALDDFGTGYSSLSYLTHLPIGMIKIDRSLVQDLGSSAADEAVVSAISSLARRLGQVVLAEGVEDQTQLDRAMALGCRFAQGYHLGKPAPARELALVAVPLAVPQVRAG